MCFSHLFSMSSLLLLLVVLYGISTGFSHGIRLYFHLQKETTRTPKRHSSPINFLPNLPSIQVSPTHRFKHNNETVSLCGPSLVNSIISGTGLTWTGRGRHITHISIV